MEIFVDSTKHFSGCKISNDVFTMLNKYIDLRKLCLVKHFTHSSENWAQRWTCENQKVHTWSGNETWLDITFWDNAKPITFPLILLSSDFSNRNEIHFLHKKIFLKFLSFVFSKKKISRHKAETYVVIQIVRV